METFIILPTQLFNKKYLDKKYKYIIWEHPHYFDKYNYNQKKIILHYSSMKYYYDYLKENKFNVSYKKGKLTTKNYKIFDPIDKITLPNNYEIIESPNFLLTKNQYQKYRNKTKNFMFNAFYTFGKKEIDIIPDIKSRDKYNRKSFNNKIKIPDIPSNNNDKKYIDIGIKLCNKKYSKNYGNTNNFIFPVSHKTAEEWLDHFIQNKFENFGKYQDAIVKGESYMFHSLLSTSINIGLLNPSDIIEKIRNLEKKININSFEGYIRQLFWREYQRYCYIYYDFENKNYFNYKNKLKKDWYNGTLNIEPVDDCIIKAFDTGYLHHIERLMIMGNYMSLSEIDPKEGFRWFIEFSCDSYEWVMVQNVYDMVFFVSGGKTMRKPYISSSNYILKMSNYKKGNWSEEWNKKYNNFLKKHKNELWKFRYHFRGLKNI